MSKRASRKWTRERRTDMAGTAPVGVEIDERVLVATDLCVEGNVSELGAGKRERSGEREAGASGGRATYDIAELGDRGHVGDHVEEDVGYWRRGVGSLWVG